jgi:hypothetical protein
MPRGRQIPVMPAPSHFNRGFRSVPAQDRGAGEGRRVGTLPGRNHFLPNRNFPETKMSCHPLGQQRGSIMLARPIRESAAFWSD